MIFKLNLLSQLMLLITLAVVKTQDVFYDTSANSNQNPDKNGNYYSDPNALNSIKNLFTFMNSNSPFSLHPKVPTGNLNKFDNPILDDIINDDNDNNIPNISEIDPSNLNPLDMALNIKEPITGLAVGTFKFIMSVIPPCKQPALINYKKLMENPVIRTQFFKDLYQRKQRNKLDGCADGTGEIVHLNYNDREILLRDPFFRLYLETLMAKESINPANNKK